MDKEIVLCKNCIHLDYVNHTAICKHMSETYIDAVEGITCYYRTKSCRSVNFDLDCEHFVKVPTLWDKIKKVFLCI